MNEICAVILLGLILWLGPMFISIQLMKTYKIEYLVYTGFVVPLINIILLIDVIGESIRAYTRGE